MKSMFGRSSESSKGHNGPEGDEEGKQRPTFRDIGGLENVLENLETHVLNRFRFPHLIELLGARSTSPLGILIHGPPGCGKTTLAHAIANEIGFPFYNITSTDLNIDQSGVDIITKLFSDAYSTRPSIVFIDDIDAIAAPPEDNIDSFVHRLIVTLLKTNTDPMSDKNILVIGATSRLHAIDPVLRTSNCFLLEYELVAPNETARREIISILVRNLRLEESFDILKVAKETRGFVGADLQALVNKASCCALARIGHIEDCSKLRKKRKQPLSHVDLESAFITMTDFEEAIKMIQPSLTLSRDYFSVIPSVKWEDVGGLEGLREKLGFVVGRLKHPQLFVRSRNKILLYGPPGCGKTLIAEAIANEAEANFFHIKAQELLNKYFSDRRFAVHALFNCARACAPCIIFIDDVDVLMMQCDKGGERAVEQLWSEVDVLTARCVKGGERSAERLLSELFTWVDKVQEDEGVFVMSATNRPDVVDKLQPIKYKPGGFGEVYYVHLPSPNERGLILKALGNKIKMSIDGNVDLHAIGRMEACGDFSGEDLYQLMIEAEFLALSEKFDEVTSACSIKMVHFERGLARISPSVREKRNIFYRDWSEKEREALLNCSDGEKGEKS